jgi:predicted DNA-binding ribbon-helix-helix protein
MVWIAFAKRTSLAAAPGMRGDMIMRGFAAKVVAADYHVQIRHRQRRRLVSRTKVRLRFCAFRPKIAGRKQHYERPIAADCAQNQQEREVTMCRVFAGQDPEGYRQINRSIRIDGRSTSIQLEGTFWTLLDEIAESQGLTTPKFISKLYDEAIEINGQIPNFASMLRTTCALYLRGHRAGVEEHAAPKRRAA